MLHSAPKATAAVLPRSSQHERAGAIGVARPSGQALRLWLCGIAMIVPMIAFGWRYPLVPNSATLTDIGKLSQYQRTDFFGYALGFGVLFALYLLALHESRSLPAQAALPAVFVCGTGMALGMVWMYPVSAIDVFLYAVRSRLLTAYGQNPISVPFSVHPNDPWMPFATSYWAERVSPYGPLWNAVAAPITALSGDRMAVALIGFKLLCLLCALACTWLIARTLAATGRADAATGALLFLWNPLVLWESVGNAHNDVVLTLLLLLALYAWAAQRNVLVLPALVLATLLKYVTLPLLPLAAIALWRRAPDRAARWRLIVWSVVGSALAAAVALYPFDVLGALRASVAQQGAIAYTSPASVALALLHNHYPSEQIMAWATWAGAAVLLAALALAAIAMWRQPERFPRVCFEVLYVFLLVAVASSRAWYLIWLVALAALLPWGWPTWRAIAWTAGALAGYAFFIWIEAWWQPGYDRAQVVGTALILGGTLALTGAEIAAHLRVCPTRAAVRG